MFASEPGEADGALRAHEAREAREKAAQVAEEAFRQIRDFQAMPIGENPGLQKADGSFESGPRLPDDIGLPLRLIPDGYWLLDHRPGPLAHLDIGAAQHLAHRRPFISLGDFDFADHIRHALDQVSRAGIAHFLPHALDRQSVSGLQA